MALEGKTSTGGSVLNRQFMVVLLLAVLGFGWEQLLRSLIPLVVIDRGGGPALVGLVTAVYSLPALLFRPTIGRLVDSWHHSRLLQLGALVAAVTPAGLLALPGILLLVPLRFLQGAGWACYSVSAQAFMAKIAPADRRGTASGYYQAMIAVALLVAPGLGTWLYVTRGLGAPVVLSAGLGLIALVVAARVRIPVQARAGDGDASPPARWSGLNPFRSLERAALPSTLMLASFMSAQSLFTVFAPVYVLSIGAPVESLVLYYPIYGGVLAVSQLAAGPLSDRVGRALAIRLGCVMAIFGLAVAGLGNGMAALTVGAGAFAVGVSLVSSATSALTIDRAPVGKLGAAMATYSLGYQLASGMGSLVWGALIAASGFLMGFGTAIALQALTLALTFRFAVNALSEPREPW